jgi:hypothetical protein
MAYGPYTSSQKMVHALYKVPFSHESPRLGHASNPKNRGLILIKLFTLLGPFIGPWAFIECIWK